MSYDLMVFDPGAAPQGRTEFMRWYERQAEWSEDHSYLDPVVCSDALRAWFLDMITRFPAMNGPHASDDVDDPSVTDYGIGESVIYGAFAWSRAEAARRSDARASREAPGWVLRCQQRRRRRLDAYGCRHLFTCAIVTTMAIQHAPAEG